MTRVRIDLRHLGLAGVDTPARGRIWWEPTRRVRVDGDDVHLVLPQRVGAVAAGTAVVVDVEPAQTADGWCYKVTEQVDGGDVRYVLVPPADPDDPDAVVDYANLVDVDPATLTPLDPLPPSAAEVLEQAAHARDDAETAARAAEDARDAIPAASVAPTPSTVPERTAAGTIKTAAPVEGDDAVSLAAVPTVAVAGETRPAEGTQTDGQNVVVGSFGHIAPGGATNVVSGGSPNYENVIGGNPANVNTATSNLTGAPTLVAPDGNWNSVWGGYDVVCNGWANQVQGYHCVVHTGGNHGTISGGSAHIIETGIGYGTVGGGTANVIDGNQGTVSGGSGNRAGLQGSVGGGITNTASGAKATVAGGATNTAAGANAAIGGGSGNNASGNGACIPGGVNNTASEANATAVGGLTNTASGNSSTVVGGLTNTASATGATVVGGRDNIASGQYAIALGRDASAPVTGMTARANGKFAAVGDAQAVDYVLRRQTLDAVATQLFTDGVGTYMAVPENTTLAFEVLVVARRTDVHGEGAGYKITGVVDRGVGSTAAMVGTPVVTVLAEDTPAWDVSIAAVASGTLRIAVTGEAGKTIRWVARASLVSVSG